MLTISVLYWRKRGGSAESGVFLPTRMRSRSVVVVWRHPTMYMLPNTGRPIIFRAFVVHRLSVFLFFKIVATWKIISLKYTNLIQYSPFFISYEEFDLVLSSRLAVIVWTRLQKKRNGRHFETAQLITLKFTLQLIVNLLISPNLSKLLSRLKKIGDYCKY